jgi:hypothetical protein
MTHMFCTLKQAADRLQTTETEIETLLNDGILREFRDGGNRLVKVFDLDALAAELCPAGADHPARRQRMENPRPSTVIHYPSSVTGSASRGSSAAQGITLPLTPAAVPGVRRSWPEPARRPPSPTPQTAGRVSGHSAKGVRADRRPSGPAASSARPGRVPRAARKPVTRRNSNASAAASTPAFTPQRPRPQSQELSLREWMWMGLLDDRPHTILALFAALVLAACTVTGAAYLVIRAL